MARVLNGRGMVVEGESAGVDSDLELARGGLARFGLCGSQGIGWLGDTVGSFDDRLAVDPAVRVRLLSPNMVRSGGVAMNGSDVWSESLEVCVGGEVWTPPGERAGVGLYWEHMGEQGWCVQMLLPTNFRWGSGDSGFDARVIGHAAAFGMEEFGRMVDGDRVRYAPGCLELWVPNGCEWLEVYERDAHEMDGMARRWLRQMDYSFAPSVQGVVVDGCEARRQLRDCDCYEGEVMEQLRFDAIRFGRPEGAGLVDVAQGKGGWYVMALPESVDGRPRLALGAGYSKAAAAADAVAKYFESGLWPLHPKDGLGEVFGRYDVMGSLLTEGVLDGSCVPCTREYASAVQALDGPCPLENVEGCVLGEDVADFGVLMSGSTKWRMKGGVRDGR